MELNYQDKIDIKNALDLLINCVNDDYKHQILDVYKTDGPERRRVQALYRKL
jgi:hypothetical protein|tara:strand:+ start:80 stop:235 length:156 start_codon:yes stop_codon:yes gene_type:complete